MVTYEHIEIRWLRRSFLSAKLRLLLVILTNKEKRSQLVR